MPDTRSAKKLNSRASVAAHPEEGGVPEGHHAQSAEHEVEADGEDRPDGRQGDQLDQRFTRVEEGQQDAGRGQQQAEADVEQGEFHAVLAAR
jgi:hypothetical protein